MPSFLENLKLQVRNTNPPNRIIFMLSGVEHEKSFIAGYIKMCNSTPNVLVAEQLPSFCNFSSVLTLYIPRYQWILTIYSIGYF